MLRWLVKFIDEKRDSWDEENREEKRKHNALEDWTEKSRDEIFCSSHNRGEIELKGDTGQIQKLRRFEGPNARTR